jgi:crotonobetainyl-CoA:carnitine CoA-transferase CaiB-like acyl-CoA transferase
VRNFGAMRNGVGAMFSVVNRNKRSIALDLKSDGGRRVLKVLLSSADVLIENFRPGVMRRLGFGYEEVAGFNPRIIYGSITGYGADGCYADRRAYDPVVQGVSGIASIQADPATGAPGLVRTAICDKVTALTFSQAITAALFGRERTGRGEHVQIAMLDAALAFAWPEAMYNHTFLEDFPLAQEFSTGSPVYEASDGFFVVAALNDQEYAGLWRAIGRPELIDDPRVASMPDRSRSIDFINETVGQAVRAMNGDELEAALIREDVPAARINTRASLINDPQVVHNGSIVECEHPVAGRMRQPRSPATFTSAPAAPPRPAPMLGEHTDAVLAECGLCAEDIRALKASGAAVQA